MKQEYTFDVSFPGAEIPVIDILGTWEPAPSSRYLIGDGGIGASLLFHAELPTDPALTFNLLDARERKLTLGQQALPVAEKNLSADLNQIMLVGDGGAAYSLGVGNFASARSILAAGLQHQGLGISFRLLDMAKIDPLQLDQAAVKVGYFAKQVQSTIDQLAHVQTTCAGMHIGFTRAAWSGDIETWWSAAATHDQRLQHEHVLAQALTTRQAWVRFLLLVAGGIARVSASLATGPFSPVTIWTTWNYLLEVIKEYQNLAKG